MTTPGETASQAVQVRDLARVLQPEQGLYDPTNLRKAVVVSVQGTVPPSVDIKLSGAEETISGIAIINGYSPYVNDVVIVAKQGNGLLVLGSVSESGAWTTATLLSGYGHNGNGGGSVQYRRVWDSGWKMEWRGCASRVAGSSKQVIGNLTSEFSPRSAREVPNTQEDEGLNSGCRLEFTSAGNVWFYGWDAKPGINSFQHSHGGNIANTTITPSTYVNDPGWLSFEGVTYYL